MNRHTPSRTMSITMPAALAVISAAFGCGGRPEAWSTAIEQPAVSFGLTGAVAVLDRPADRVVLLTAEPDQRLRTRSVATGRNITNAVALPDGSKLFVISAGHRAHLGDKETDQPPSLTVIDGAVDPDGKQPVSKRIDLGGVLTDPLSGLAVDPKGRWLVLYAGGGATKAFVENPNELLILDLSRDVGTDNPAVHTLQSFGGRPVRLTFTGPLNLPVGRRELLVVESDQDLSILQLEMPKQSELTIPLTSGLDARRLQPAEIAVDDGEPARNDDARIGVRLLNDRTVITMQLEASAGGAGFKPTLNLTDVGGVPSDIHFVRTDGGLRLAALVPGTSSAVLIDPLTSLTTTVALPAPYARLSLVTGSGGTAAPAADVALLWNGGNGKEGIAFWALGQTAGQPYRSIETVGVAAAIDAVFDVPEPNQALKVLKTSKTNAFFVLDLKLRTAAPLVTSTSNIAMTVSPKGERVWTFTPQGVDLAVVDLIKKHPRTLLLERPVQDVHEIARTDGNRALVAVHNAEGVGATVFDALTADDATRRLYAGVLLGGL
ncbi:MAG TPA: hypothetical protein VFH73_18005 [Polyangia bacterium]|nr:hypothetical protein [Polyangia bacterium]